MGFRSAPGFSERVIFREMFLQGLTVLDIPDKILSISHIAARQEVRDLLRTLRIPLIDQKLAETATTAAEGTEEPAQAAQAEPAKNPLKEGVAA